MKKEIKNFASSILPLDTTEGVKQSVDFCIELQTITHYGIRSGMRHQCIFILLVTLFSLMLYDARQRWGDFRAKLPAQKNRVIVISSYFSIKM